MVLKFQSAADIRKKYVKSICSGSSHIYSKFAMRVNICKIRQKNDKTGKDFIDKVKYNINVRQGRIIHQRGIRKYRCHGTVCHKSIWYKDVCLEDIVLCRSGDDIPDNISEMLKCCRKLLRLPAFII